MSRTQQKYFNREALPSKWLSIFFNTGHNRTTWLRAELWVLSNTHHLFDGCLSKKIRKINRRRISLHHNTTSSHTSTEAAKFLSTRTIHLMKHPRYSPDLAPNDFCFGTHVLEIQYAGNWFKFIKKRKEKFWKTIIRLLNSYWIFYQMGSHVHNHKFPSGFRLRSHNSCSNSGIHINLMN